MIITGTRVRGGRYYGGTGSASDAYFDLVALLLPGNGTNGAQNNTFQDSSTNAFTITRNGNTTQGTFSPFSQTGWSNYLNGSSYFTAPGSTAFAFGTGAFTIEMWLYVTAYPANYAVIPSNRPYNAGSTDTWGVFFFNDGAVRFSDVNNTQTFQTSAGAVPLNAWTHLAVVRNSTASNDTKIYINGTSVAQGTINSNFANNTNAVVFGTSYDSNNWYVTSYASNLRIVKGTAVYTSNFTPSTTALTNISGTSLLTCQSNRFVDNSSNIFAISLSGTPSVQAFSPFNPTTAYAAGTVGGSGYFDGTGDSLSIAGSAALGTTGDLTLEAWVYVNSVPNYAGIFSMRNSVNSDGLAINILNTGYLDFSIDGSSAGEYTGTLAPLRQWCHVALVRSGSSTNNVSCYLNGNRVGQFTSNFNTNGASNAAIVGRYYATGADQYNLNGYIGSLRYVVGTALYSGTTLTVPTAPFTAIANTAILLNYTNGGITDATAKNVLETVGSAQISTAQSKFGGSSMAFDGTGDYLVVPVNPAYNFGSGNLTLEMWINTTSSTQYATLCSKTPSTFGTGMWTLTINYASSTAGDVVLVVNEFSNVTPLLLTTGVNVRDGNWHHVAVVRNGASWVLYVDGTSRATNTWSGTITNLSAGVYIGADQFYGRAYTGYIDDVRITTGLARYTANFTPPTAAFPTQ